MEPNQANQIQEEQQSFKQTPKSVASKKIWLYLPILIIAVCFIIIWAVYREVASTASRVVGNDYVVSSSHVYYKGEAISDADPNTFTIVGGNFAKDAQHVFFEHLNKIYIVQGADPKTFIYMGGHFYGKDANHVYFHNRPFQEADPKTFIYVGDLGFCKMPSMLIGLL